MADPFDSSRRKLARAKEHIRDFTDSVRLFEEQNPCVRSIDPDPQNSEYRVHKLKLRLPIPDSLELVAADALTNLRAALDQAGYAVAIAAGIPKPKRTAFPFAGTAAELENAIKGRSKDIPQEILAIFRALKPYKGGNDILCALNDLCNTDKHMRLTPVAGSVLRERARFESKSIDAFFSTPEKPTWDAAKNEIVLFTVSANADLHYNFDIVFFIAFGEVKAVSDHPAATVLSILAAIVEHVLRAIEAECRRLGLFK